MKSFNFQQLLQRKSLDALVAETEGEGRSLKKVLGPLNLIMLGVGAIIGAGIFATIGTATAGDAHRPGAGPALMVSLVLTAVVCGFTALCYAEFASMVPVSGSAYTYSYATLGELVAWIIGWDLILEYAIGNVAVAISWSNYFDTLVTGLGFHIPRWLVVDYRTVATVLPVTTDFPAVNEANRLANEAHAAVMAAAPHLGSLAIVFNLPAIMIVALLTVLLVWGVKESARFNAVMVGVKLLVLVFFVLVSTRFVKPEHWHPFAPNGFKGIGAGAAVIFFAYIGFDAVSTCAEECKNPERDMPIGIIGSLVICTVVYVVIAAIFTGMMPYSYLIHASEGERAEPLTLAMKFVDMPSWMIGIVAFGSVIAQAAVLLVFQLGQPRILFAMARDGFLPPMFAKVHPKFGTPHVATIVTGVVVSLTAGIANIDEMVDLTNIGTLFAFILVCLGIMILRFRDPGRKRPFRVPLGPVVIPGLGLCSCVFLICYLPPTSWLRFFAWLVVGLAVYLAYGHRHSTLAGRNAK